MKFYRIRENIGSYSYGTIVGFEEWELLSLIDDLAEDCGFSRGHEGGRNAIRARHFEEISL